MLYIGADHRGYELKEEIKKYLEEKDIKYIDVGTNSKEITHYPIIVKNAVKNIKESDDNTGILICSSGTGMSIAANKFKGIRAGLAIDEEMAKEVKAHEDCNILILPADYITVSKAVAIIRTWMATEVMGGRYQDRLQMIKEIEDENMK